MHLIKIKCNLIDQCDGFVQTGITAYKQHLRISAEVEDYDLKVIFGFKGHMIRVIIRLCGLSLLHIFISILL